MGSPDIVESSLFNKGNTRPPLWYARSDDPLRGDPVLEPFCNKSHNRVSEGMSGHNSLRAFLSGGGNKKLQRWILAASQALYQWLCFWGNMSGWTAVSSQHAWFRVRGTGAHAEAKLLWRAVGLSVGHVFYPGKRRATGGLQRGRVGPIVLYLQSDAFCASAKQGVTVFPISVKCFA